MQYSLAKIAEIVQGQLIGNGDTIIEEVFIDSRKKVSALGSLFFAIKGEQHDGHSYIPGLINDGFKSFLVNKLPEDSVEQCNFIVVENVLRSLQVFATYHRNQYNLPVIGITGSNGKTIVKEWCYQLLFEEFNVVRNPRSYNSQVGVPLSILQITNQNQIGIFEAGISRPGEMNSLRPIIRPNIGLFTNIGDAHASGFLNESEKIYEKLHLFEKCESLIYRKEDNLLTDILDRFIEENDIQPITWSDTNKATLQVLERTIVDNATKITVQYGSRRMTAMLPFIDDASFENAMHAWLLALTVQADPKKVTDKIASLQTIEMRLNQKAGINNCLLVSDFYNSDLKSIEIALDWTNQRHSQLSKTIIISDIEQSSTKDRDLYTQIQNLLEKHQYTRLIGIGPKLVEHQFLFNIAEQKFYSDTSEFLSNFDPNSFNNEAVLIKGARSFAFEQIEKMLQQKVHNTVLEINLNALQQNLNYFKSLTDASTKIMVMVKAFSYGNGGDEIAHFLQHNNIDYLGVAYADEGVALRKKGIKLPIMVMNSDEDSFDVMLEYDLEPELYNKRSLTMFIDAVTRKAVAEAKAHIEVNTGMNRLGFDLSEVDDVAKVLHLHNGIKIQSIFSHFAASEDAQHDDFSIGQIASLNAFHTAFVAAMGYKPMKHIANSAGAIRFKESHYDMIRLGVGLYGFHPSENHGNSIIPISTLKSFISQIRVVPANDGVGYGRLGAADKDRKIAVVAIGYADGLSRLLSNGNGYFVIHGSRAPIVGNICMDMTMCDVTDIDCQEGDEVIVFGDDPSIVTLAEKTNTIAYEIMTSISPRVKRVYSEE